MKPIGPWTAPVSCYPRMNCCRCTPDGKLAASINTGLVRGDVPGTTKKVHVALIHVTYPDMSAKERELAERGQSIPVPEDATLEQARGIADAWLEEIGFDARSPATSPDYVI